MTDEMKYRLVLHTIEKYNLNPFDNLTALDVAKDLKIGKNKVYQLFNDKDFPSVEIGKTKVVMVLSYYLWKLEKQCKLEGKGN